MASLLNEFPRQASNPRQMQDYNRLVQKLISAIEKIDDTDVINKVFNSVGLSNPEEEQITEEESVFYNDTMKFKFPIIKSSQNNSI